MQDGLVSLASEGFDLAVRHIDVPPDTYVARALCRTRTLLVASPRYQARHGTPSQPSQVEEHRHLLYPRHPSVATWTFEKIGTRVSHSLVTVPMHSSFVANNSGI